MQGGRRKAREVVFRAVFETEITHEDLLEILEYSLGRYHLTEDGKDHAVTLARHLRSRRAAIGQLIANRLLHWEFSRLSAVVRAILLLAVAELEATDVPLEVVLDEAVELAHRYGEEDSGKFVNGVLDPLAAQLRPKDGRSESHAPRAESARRSRSARSTDSKQGTGKNRRAASSQGSADERRNQEPERRSPERPAERRDEEDLS